MKSYLLLFLTIVITIYGLVNYYIWRRGVQSLEIFSDYRKLYTVVFWGLASSYIIARFLERFYMCLISDFFIWVGSFWLGFMLYAFLFVLLIDVIRLSNWAFNWYPNVFIINKLKISFVLGVIVCFVVLILIIIGHINAIYPKVTKINLTIDKQYSKLNELNIVAVSDVHMGEIINRRRIANMVEEINKLNPDIVFFVGDLVDENIEPVIRHDLGNTLKKIISKYGVFAVTGNHEYIGGVEQAVDYLEQYNIQYLRDTSICIDSSFYIIGREDKDSKRFINKERKDISSLMQTINQTLPVILLDHQPFKIADVAKQNIDLQISGHTHHGQLFPLNYITNAVFEVSHGYKKIDHTHFYVSSGYGSWGPPVRIGTRSEIVNIRLKFN